MSHKIILFILSLFLLVSCGSDQTSEPEPSVGTKEKQKVVFNVSSITIKETGTRSSLPSSRDTQGANSGIQSLFYAVYESNTGNFVKLQLYDAEASISNVISDELLPGAYTFVFLGVDTSYGKDKESMETMHKNYLTYFKGNLNDVFLVDRGVHTYYASISETVSDSPIEQAITLKKKTSTVQFKLSDESKVFQRAPIASPGYHGVKVETTSYQRLLFKNGELASYNPNFIYLLYKGASGHEGSFAKSPVACFAKEGTTIAVKFYYGFVEPGVSELINEVDIPNVSPNKNYILEGTLYKDQSAGFDINIEDTPAEDVSVKF